MSAADALEDSLKDKTEDNASVSIIAQGTRGLDAVAAAANN
jgi:hypothetical protein